MRKLAWMLSLLLFVSLQMFAQDRTVTGKVTDENGMPIANATVLVKGGTKGTKTSADGSFKIVVSSSARQLVVSSVGFESLTVIITGGVQAIQLKASAGELTGVVVTGYSKVKKSEYVGASSRIDKKAIEMVPSASFDQILQGRAPGLVVTATSGQPGAGADVVIRGPKSIEGGSTPLYIVDGVPVEAGVFREMNPNDFESVDVLKDASAAALYGSRGASGVIVITTKRGKKGATSFSYKSQYGITQPGAQQFTMMNSAELLQFQEKYGLQQNLPNAEDTRVTLPGWYYSRNNPANAGLTPQVLATYDRALDSLRSQNTQWNKVFQRQGKFQNHDLSIGGGNDKTQFYTSASYYDEQGIGLRSDLKRYTLRFNLDHKTDKLTMQLNSNAGYSKANVSEPAVSGNSVSLRNPFAAAYFAPPYDPLLLPDGRVNVPDPTSAENKLGGFAYQGLKDIFRYNDQFKFSTTLLLNYDITKNIYAGSNLGFDLFERISTVSSKTGSYTTSFLPSTDPRYLKGTYSDAFLRNFRMNARGFIGYKNTFGSAKQHSLNVSINGEYSSVRLRDFTYRGFLGNNNLQNTPADIIPGTVENNLIPTVGGGKTQRAFVSNFAMLKYGYKEKYIFDFTIRRDGASNLPQQNRFQNFWAAGFVWNTLKESFTRDWSNVSTLRLRASYGSSANAENFPFGDFGYLPLYGSSSYAGIPTLLPSAAGNTAGDWEYTDKANVGIEFGFWRERLTGEVNFYNEVTRNLFITQNLPVENGAAFTSALVNAGKLRNRGIELVLKYDVISNKDFNWSVGGNVAYNENRILSLGNEKEYIFGTAIVRVGLPLGSHYFVKWGGVDAATGAPLYYTRDGKLTNAYSPSNAVADFGSSTPVWTGGFNTSLRYKGFDLNAFFNFQADVFRYNNMDFFQLRPDVAKSGYNMQTQMLTMWTKPGDVTNIPSSLYPYNSNSKFVQDASYLRFRNLQLGYTVPSSVLAKRANFIKGIRFVVQVQNLYTWTKWTGFDPEVASNVAVYDYPVPRTYTVGLNLNF